MHIAEGQEYDLDEYVTWIASLNGFRKQACCVLVWYTSGDNPVEDCPARGSFLFLSLSFCSFSMNVCCVYNEGAAGTFPETGKYGLNANGKGPCPHET